MNRILIWTEHEITGLRETWGLSRILTEVDSEGKVTREIGLNEVGDVIHRHPGEPSRAAHGVFDLAKIALSDGLNLDAAEFERLWTP